MINVLFLIVRFIVLIVFTIFRLFREGGIQFALLRELLGNSSSRECVEIRLELLKIIVLFKLSSVCYFLFVKKKFVRFWVHRNPG